MHKWRVHCIHDSATCANARANRRGRRAAALGVVVLMLAATALVPAGAATAASARALASWPAAIPAHYLTWYRRAARTCPGLTWEVLAGIGTMESNNGRSNARGVHKGKNRKGAEGPMQFLPATFAEYAVKVDPSRKLTPYDPADAIFTAARMLCANGAGGGSPRGLRRAIFAYNHACWYVRDVLAIASRYTASAGTLRHSRHHPHHRQRGHRHMHHGRRHHPRHPHRHRGRRVPPC